MTVNERDQSTTPASITSTDPNLEGAAFLPGQVKKSQISPERNILDLFLHKEQTFWSNEWKRRLLSVGLSLEVPLPKIPDSIRNKVFNGYPEKGKADIENFLLSGDLGLLYIPKGLTDLSLLKSLGLVLPNCLTLDDAILFKNNYSRWMIYTNKPYPYKNMNAMEQRFALQCDGFIPAGGLESLLIIGREPNKYVDQRWARVLGSRNSFDNHAFGFEAIRVCLRNDNSITTVTRAFDYLGRYENVGTIGVMELASD